MSDEPTAPIYRFQMKAVEISDTPWSPKVETPISVLASNQEQAYAKLQDVLSTPGEDFRLVYELIAVDEVAR